MDDDSTEFEDELRRLRPTPVPRRLVAVLERELAVPARRHTSLRLCIWAGALPVAAAIVVGIALAVKRDRPNSATTAAPPVAGTAVPAPVGFRPVAVENVLYAAHDEGLVTLADGTPAHRERLNYVDTITWRNPRTNASVRWTVPREEVRVVPASFQ